MKAGCLPSNFSPMAKRLPVGVETMTSASGMWKQASLSTHSVNHYDWIFDIAVSPHGNILIACDNHYEIRIWNLDTGEVLKKIVEYSHRPRSVIFSADGNRFATGGYDSRIYMWDVATGMKIRPFHNPQKFRSCCLQSNREHDGSRSLRGISPIA